LEPADLCELARVAAIRKTSPHEKLTPKFSAEQGNRMSAA